MKTGNTQQTKWIELNNNTKQSKLNLPGEADTDEASENLLLALCIFLNDGGLFWIGEAIVISHSVSESSSSLNLGRAGRLGALKAVEVLVESGEKLSVLELWLSVELL